MNNGNNEPVEGVFRTIGGEADDISELQGDLDEQLRAVLSSFGDELHNVDYKIKVYRPVKGAGGELEWLFDCLMEDLPVSERLRDEYGGGSFRVHILRGNKMYRRLVYRIGMPRPYAGAKQQNDGNDTVALLRELMQQQQKQFEQYQGLLLAAAQRTQVPTPPAQNPLAVLEPLIALIPLVREFMPRQTGIGDLIGMMRGWKELMPARGGDGSERGMWDAFTEISRQFGPALQTAMAQQPKPAPPATAGALPAPAPGAAAVAGPRPELGIGRRDFARMPLVRRLSNTLGAAAFSWAVGRPIPDNQSGYRLVGRRLMAAMADSRETGFEFEVEIERPADQPRSGGAAAAALQGLAARGDQFGASGEVQVVVRGKVESRPPIDDDLAALVLFQAVEGANEGRFTRPGWPEYHDHLTFFDFHANPF